MRATWIALLAALAGCHVPVIAAPLWYADAPTAPLPQPRDPRPPLGPVREVLDESPRETVLANGVHVVFVPRHDVPIVAARVVISRGAVDVEDAGAIASSQMAFFFQRGGSDARHERTSSAADHLGTSVERWDRSDGHQLAVRVTPGDLAGALALLADLTIDVDLTDAEYELQTIPWRDGATHLRPIDLAMQRAMLFGTISPYGHAGWGRARLDRQALQALRQRIYQPAHATIVVVGDVAPEAVDAAVTRSFGAWAGGAPLPSVSTEPPFDHGVRIAWRKRGGMTETVAGIFFRGPDPRTGDLPAFHLLTYVLGAPTSRLFAELREGQGAVYTPGAAITVERAASWVTFESLYDPDKLVRGLRTVIERVRAFRAGAVDDAEVEAAREALVAVWRGQMATAAGAARSYAEAIVLGRPLDSVRDFPAELARVQKAELVRVANRYLTDDALRIAVVGGEPDLELGTFGLGPVLDIKLGGQ